jgi:hypothetical protein
LARIKRAGIEFDEKFNEAIARGYKFWRSAFFLADGWPKYYDDSPYPADAHAAAAAVVTLCDLQHFDSEVLAFASTVATWCIENLRDEDGFFYYQRRRLYTVRTAYMRWSQAWMLYALARLLESENISEE